MVKYDVLLVLDRGPWDENEFTRHSRYVMGDTFISILLGWNLRLYIIVPRSLVLFFLENPCVFFSQIKSNITAVFTFERNDLS